jgi:hypothetical protein
VNRKPAVLATTLVLGLLAGCNQGAKDFEKGNDAGEVSSQRSGAEVARQLEQAAKQSSPMASESLERSADEARSQGTMAEPGQPDSFAQRAMKKAATAGASDAPPAKR